ncbi:MAG: hypothetical protein WBO45_07685, partial [Planctomycetota bacterium]
TTLADSGGAHVRWTTAHDALKAGDFAAARRHLYAALEFHPSSPLLLFALALALRDDKDLAPLWAERFARAAADANGRVRIDPAWRKQFTVPNPFEASLKPGTVLAEVRASAIAELARFVDRNKPAAKQNMARAVLVRWASEVLLEVGHGAPQPLAAVAPAVGRIQDAFQPDYEIVFQGLARLLQGKVGAGPTTGTPNDPATLADRRIRAARILVGLRRQAAFGDLQGPRPPDLGRHADDAQQVLDEYASADVANQRVWSIAELEAMSPEDAVRFTATHRDWKSPGIALSTSGRYRLETTCGHDTLLQTAKTIELHHARLVGHYGSDPFLQRPGLVRIAPEASDLETEGAPYWWAGGFQAGDRTTVRFAWGNIPALGRTLTHELTHRFDGVLRPFLGAWYGEGHAQWTGQHYGRMAAKEFVELYLDRGAAATTYYKGYGRQEEFGKLLAGQVTDYRDNYPAGYSLYVFLRSFPPDKPRYRDALPSYEKNARGGQRDPLAYFASTFCDGKQGRPATFDEFWVDWERFLKGCYDWPEHKKPEHRWIEKYGDLGGDDYGQLVMDEPTWSWARTRAEPFFGQDHAFAATLLLHEVGDGDATIAAGLWSTTVDGWRPETANAVLAALRTGKAQDAAAAFAAIAQRHFPEIAAPEPALLLSVVPRSKALLEALAARTQALAADSPAASAALVEDHARIGGLFGLARLTNASAGAPPSLPRHLGGHGFTETSLTGYDERRVAGLWYASPDGDLHVGRERPRDGTGSLDRASHQRHAFVHTVGWQAPGQYVLRGRVYLTTSYVSGAIVFGHVRRDRDLRLHFSSGDFDYATGRTEVNERSGNVTFELHGLWERDGDGKLPDPGATNSIEVSPDAPWFDFALHVRGPRVLVEINGEVRMRYAVHDGSPIEGHVGFAMSMGAIRVQLPTVQRIEGDLAEVTQGLALDRQPGGTRDDLLLLPVRGIPTGPDGTLVLWLPAVSDGSPMDLLPRALPHLAKMLVTTHEHPQAWVLAVPKAMPAEERAKALAAIADLRPDPMPLLEHVVGAPFTGNDPWVLFVDGRGMLRAAAAVNEPGLHVRVSKWSRMFRAR